MKTKRFISILAAMMCLTMLVTAVPFATSASAVEAAAAVKAPSAPYSVKFVSDYAVNEHYLSFKHSGSCSGYNVIVKDAGGRQVWFYNIGKAKIVNNFTTRAKLKDGQFYTVEVRAFNKNKTGTIVKDSKPGICYAAETTTKIKASRASNKKSIKISWNAVKGSTNYNIIVPRVNGQPGATYYSNTTSKTFTKIGGYAASKVRNMYVIIVPYKTLQTGSYRGAYWKNEYQFSFSA